MIIRKEIYRYKQANRNFIAIFECEHCGHQFVGRGYSDDNFFNNVMPGAKCPKCKSIKRANKEEREYIISETDYPKWQRAFKKWKASNE